MNTLSFVEPKGKPMNILLKSPLVMPLVLTLALLSYTYKSQADDTAYLHENHLVEGALSSALPLMRPKVSVRKWDNTLLMQGDGPYTCYPSHISNGKSVGPVCAEPVAEAFLQAWLADDQDFQSASLGHLGFAYMLSGDFADEAAGEREQHLGPHLMIVVPERSLLDGISEQANSGLPFVRWKNTPFAYLAVPFQRTDISFTSGNPTVDSALSSGPAVMRSLATVKSWNGDVIREGSSSYTCMPSVLYTVHKKPRPPQCSNVPMQTMLEQMYIDGDATITSPIYPPMPMDIKTVSIAYRLSGSSGAANFDPTGLVPSPDNHWVVEGPHLILAVPGSMLTGVSSDEHHGGPYVMFSHHPAPVAHVMVPVPKPALATYFPKSKEDKPIHQ